MSGRSLIATVVTLESRYQELALRNPMGGPEFDADAWNELWTECERIQGEDIVRAGGTGTQSVSVDSANLESVRAFELACHTMARIDWHRLQLVTKQAFGSIDPERPALLSNALEHARDFDRRITVYANFHAHVTPPNTPPASVWTSWYTGIRPSLSIMLSELEQKLAPYVEELSLGMVHRLQMMRDPGGPPPSPMAAPIDRTDLADTQPADEWTPEQLELRDLLLQLRQEQGSL